MRQVSRHPSLMSLVKPALMGSSMAASACRVRARRPARWPPGYGRGRVPFPSGINCRGSASSCGRGVAVPPTWGEAALPGIMEVERRLLMGKQHFQCLPGIQQSDIILHRLQS